MQIGAQLHKREAQRSAILNCLKLKLQLRKLDWSATPDCHLNINLERNSKNFIEAQLKVNSRLSGKVHFGAQLQKLIGAQAEQIRIVSHNVNWSATTPKT